jgi:hypothetical protein
LSNCFFSKNGTGPIFVTNNKKDILNQRTEH